MKRTLIATVALMTMSLAGGQAALAHGRLAGAAVGAAVAPKHHRVAGAVVGSMVGHHMAKTKQKKQEAAQAGAQNNGGKPPQ